MRLGSRLLGFATLGALALAPAAPAAPVALSPRAPGGCAGIVEVDALSRAGAAPRCLPAFAPETFGEAMRAVAQRAARETAPYGRVAPGAREHAAAEYQYELAHRDASIPGTTGSWRPAGQAPLYNDNGSGTTYNQAPTGSLSTLGYPRLSGRLTSFAYDPRTTGRWFLSSAGGGVWETTDSGAAWHSVGETLPDQTIGAIGFTTANGGTLIAVSGDNAQANNTPLGTGTYWSTDDGATWHRAAAVPDSEGFKVAVDPTNPTIVYAATGHGLWRSTDGGMGWVNVMLPTGCTDLHDWKCFFANTVSDVVVRSADSSGGGGKVMAAVGWQGGNLLDPDGKTPQAPNDGIYVSDTGAPGTFTYIDSGGTTGPATTGGAGSKNGFAAHDVIGRTALAVASGPAQSHDVVYAIVQDAQKLQGCIGALSLDVTMGCTGAQLTADPTFLDGAYMTKDWGKTWTKVMDANQLQLPGTGTALIGIPGYGPGVQSWYNLHIQVDPTMADAMGIPTRVVFGLEELWENQVAPAAPQGVDKMTYWHTAGRYWNACLAQLSGFVCNPDLTNTSPVPKTTVHPDQHAGLFIPDASGGGVTYLEGSDGGAWLQHLDQGSDFDNDKWGSSINTGVYTLQAYAFDVAADGTVIAGNQDNGVQRIDGKTGREDMIFGGDGFYTGIDPDNSSNLLEEYVGGNVNVSHDGGQNWCGNNPGFGDRRFAADFSTPIGRDPGSATHYIIGGNEIKETDPAQNPYDLSNTSRPCDETGNVNENNSWKTVFDIAGTSVSAGGVNPGAGGSDNGNKATAVDLNGESAYVGFCGTCGVAFSGSATAAFNNGIATNVGGSAPAAYASSAGWHTAGAKGLPERYITSVRMDPGDPRTVYVTLGGYFPPFVPPGAVNDDVTKVGKGHIYVSHDAGEDFTDISGDLPNAVAEWSLLRNGQLIVATDFGVYASRDATGGHFTPLGGNLPAAQVMQLRMRPGHPNQMYAATFGRGIYVYDFPAGAAPVTVATPTAAPVTVVSPSPAVVKAPLPNTARTLGLLLPLVMLLGSGAVAATLRRRRRGSPTL